MKSDIRIAIGLDVGHGESAACLVILRDSNGNLLYKDNKFYGEIKTLQVKNNTPKITSTLTYHNGKVDIGVNGGSSSVGNPSKQIYAYFKKSPTEWDQVYPGTQKTYKQLMHDFIAHLMVCILSPDINEVLAKYNKNQIALFVGCPSDQTWTAPENKAAYKKLIQNATGISKVYVVAESTASVFSTINRNISHKINPKKGIAVFDFGSSTADFTYISLGKYLAEKSWTLGASSIEKNMLNKAYDKLRKDGINPYTTDIVPIELIVRRDHKENWYGDGTTLGYKETAPEETYVAAQYFKADEFGELVDPNREPTFFTYKLNSEFMSSVLSEIPVLNVRENGSPVAIGSWMNLCQEFFQKCKKMMKHHNLECSAIVLTGGASRMDFIMPICVAAFQDENIPVFRDKSPSYCVSSGLCQIAINQYFLDTTINRIKNESNGNATSAYVKYRADVCDELSDYIYTVLVDVLQKVQGDITISQLQKKLEKHFKDNFNEQKIESLLTKPLNQLNNTLSDVIVNASVNAAANLYHTDTIRDCFSLNLDTVKKVNLDQIATKSGSVIDTKKLTPIALEISRLTINAVLSFVLYFLAGFTLVGLFWMDEIDAWCDVISEKIVQNPNRVVKQKDLQKLLEKEYDIKARIKSKIVNDLSDSIFTAQFGKDSKGYYDGVNNMLDKAVKIVALEHFDHIIID
jgi:hypothetical protein